MNNCKYICALEKEILLGNEREKLAVSCSCHLCFGSLGYYIHLYQDTHKLWFDTDRDIHITFCYCIRRNVVHCTTSTFLSFRGRRV